MGLTLDVYDMSYNKINYFSSLKKSDSFIAIMNHNLD